MREPACDPARWAKTRRSSASSPGPLAPPLAGRLQEHIVCPGSLRPRERAARLLERGREECTPTGDVIERYRNGVLNKRRDTACRTRFDKGADRYQLIHVERHRYLLGGHTVCRTTGAQPSPASASRSGSQWWNSTL